MLILLFPLNFNIKGIDEILSLPNKSPSSPRMVSASIIYRGCVTLRKKPEYLYQEHRYQDLSIRLNEELFHYSNDEYAIIYQQNPDRRINIRYYFRLQQHGSSFA